MIIRRFVAQNYNRYLSLSSVIIEKVVQFKYYSTF
jgi:hypothetical protein